MTPAPKYQQVKALGNDVYRYEVTFPGHDGGGFVASTRTSLPGHAHAQLLWRASVTGARNPEIGYCFVTRKDAAEWIAEQLGLTVDRPAAARIPDDPFQGLPS